MAQCPFGSFAPLVRSVKHKRSFTEILAVDKDCKLICSNTSPLTTKSSHRSEYGLTTNKTREQVIHGPVLLRME
jgi:hypothetical protein